MHGVTTANDEIRKARNALHAAAARERSTDRVMLLEAIIQQIEHLMTMETELTDAQIEANLSTVLAQVEATKALHDILCALKRKDVPHNYSYSDQEKAELGKLHRRHLLRRAREEAAKAKIVL